MTTVIIDAYAHCGQDKFLPLESVAACMSDAGVDKAVLCQHLGQTDNTYIGNCVRSDPLTFAGVAMIDSAAPRAAQNLATLAAEGIFRGVRLTIDMLLANPEIAGRALDLGMNVVLYSPDGLDDAVDTINRLSRGSDGGRLIITHLGCPQFDGDIMTRGSRLLDCAAAPNTMVTLSGLGMFATHPYSAAVDLVSSVLSSFGSDRVMWGSNFPVVGDTAAYAQDLRLVLDNAWELPATDIAAIAGGTAEATWFR